MRSRIQWRYFLMLLLPSLVILLLGMWLTFYSYSRGIQIMQEDLEVSRQQTLESIGQSIDTMLKHSSMSAINLSFQVDAMQNSNASQIALYNNAVDHLLFMQLNSESLFNALVDCGYIFLFDENRAITKSSTNIKADTLYEDFLRINNEDYDAFRQSMLQQHYTGKVFPNVKIGYLGGIHYDWLMMQTIPVNSSESPRGVIVFTLNEQAIIERLEDGLSDDDSFCVLMSNTGEMLTSQGKNKHWDSERKSQLLEALSLAGGSVQYISLSDQQYQVTVVPCTIGHIISAQPLNAFYFNMNHYNTTIWVLMLGMLLLALTVVIFFTNRNVSAMKRVMNTIPPEHQSGSATNVFSYMQEAILNAQQKEELLSDRASRQHSILQDIFLMGILKGEWHTESDILQEQDRIDISWEAANYVVLLVHLWRGFGDEQTIESIRQTLNMEFGPDHAFLVKMSKENAACLILSDDSELRESIEAVADELYRRLSATTLVSDPVRSLKDVSQAYRQVRVMSRMIQQDEERLYWYKDLFHDDVLYNYEYSVYTETSLRNNIAAGNDAGTMALLNELYDKNIKSSVYSDHVLRFFAYDLYRLVNHLGTGANDKARKEQLNRLRQRLDHVMEDSKQFDSFFDEVKNYCVQMCRQNENRRRNGSDEMLTRINQYIDEHFTDPDLNVNGIADALSISVKYLSLFYKEQTNGKISAYIESKRIGYACSLLDTTDRTINDVALASGYALTHTFRTAFRKVQGVTPLEWKKGRREM